MNPELTTIKFGLKEREASPYVGAQHISMYWTI